MFSLLLFCFLAASSNHLYSAAQEQPLDWLSRAIETGALLVSEHSTHVREAAAHASAPLSAASKLFKAVDVLIAATTHVELLAARAQLESRLLALNPESAAVAHYQSAQWHLKRFSPDPESPYSYTDEHWHAAVNFLLAAHRSGHPHASFQLALLLYEGRYEDDEAHFTGAEDGGPINILAQPNAEALRALSPAVAVRSALLLLSRLKELQHPYAGIVLQSLEKADQWLEEQSAGVESEAVTTALQARCTHDIRRQLAKFMPGRPCPPESTSAPTPLEEEA